MLESIDSSILIWILSGIFIVGYFVFTLAIKDVFKTSTNENRIKAYYVVLLFLFFVFPILKKPSFNWGEISYFLALLACYIIAFKLYDNYKSFIFNRKFSFKIFRLEFKFNPCSKIKYVYFILSIVIVVGFGVWTWVRRTLPENITDEFLLLWGLKIIIAFILSITTSGFLFAISELHNSTEEKYKINGIRTTGYIIGENDKSIFIWTPLKVYELHKDNIKQKDMIEKIS